MVMFCFVDPTDLFLLPLNCKTFGRSLNELGPAILTDAAAWSGTNFKGNYNMKTA
jgi:hypothetical protein